MKETLNIIGKLKVKQLLLTLAIIACIFADADAQVSSYDYGTGSGTVNTGAGTNNSGATFFPAPARGNFFYGFGPGSNSQLSAVNPGLLNLGTFTEAQASAGNGDTSLYFTKFGLMGYITANTKSSYSKFDIVLGGNTGNNTADAGVWYFFVGDGATKGQFMYNNTDRKNIGQTAVAIKWAFGTNGTLNTSYYSNATKKWELLTSDLKQTTKYTFEIYANLETTNRYSRDGVTYVCGKELMDVWVNNTRIANQVPVASQVNQSGGLKKLDSWCFYGEGSNQAYIFTDFASSSGDIGGITTKSYYSKSTGSLDVLSTWGPNTDGTGTSPLNFTTDLCTYHIVNNPNPTIGADWVVSGLDSKVIIGDGLNNINFTISPSRSFTGTLDIENNGTLTLKNKTIPTFGLLLSGSTVDYSFTGVQDVAYPVFYNLKLTGQGTKYFTTSTTVSNLITVGDGTNALTVTVPSDYSMKGTTNVNNNGTLVIQNTVCPALGTLSTGSTVEYNAIAKSTQTTQAGAIYSNLIINNAGGVSLGGDNTVNGKLTLTTGNLTLGSNTLTLNGTVARNGGTITGSSSSNLMVGGTGTLGTLSFTDGGKILNNFSFNRQTSGSAALASYLNVVGTLTLTNGIINCNTLADSITLGTSSASPGNLSFSQSGPNYTSWINGRLQRYVSSGTGTILFPVGSGSYWEGVKLIYSGNTTSGGSLSAMFTLGDPDNNNTGTINDNGYIIDRYSNYGYWTVKNNSVSGTYEINLNAYNFPGINNEPGDAKRQNLRILKRTDASAQWVMQGNHSAGNGTSSQWTAKRTGLNSFGDFTLGSNPADNSLGDSPLPVLLQSLTSSVYGRNLKLNWITSSEINNSGFEVERAEFRIQNLEFSKVGYVKGKGSTNSPTNYVYEDKNLNTGKYQYRLKQIDNNGNFEYFNLNNDVEISAPAKFELSQNYPNPFNPVTKINFDLPYDSKVKVIIYDVTGREIKTLVNEIRTAGYHTIVYDASMISSGIYFYRIIANANSKDYIATKKMILIK